VIRGSAGIQERPSRSPAFRRAAAWRRRRCWYAAIPAPSSAIPVMARSASLLARPCEERA
jgi:hypothetical protein